MKDLMMLALALDSDLMTTVRLATGGLCSAAGLDLDASEDCKVCVTESLLLLRHAGFARAELHFANDEGVFVHVTGTGERTAAVAVPEDEISAALISALAEDVAFERGEGVYKICFRFRK